MHLIAGVIALGILGISGHTLWIDRQNTWEEAERSSRNVLTTIARDLEGKLDLLDLSLQGAIEGLKYLGSQQLSPDLQYRMLFDRAATASFMGTLLVVDQDGNLIADAGPVIASRSLNVADREYFIAHKVNNHIGLYISRPFASRTRHGDPSIGISRKLSDTAGHFAGVVMGSVPLSTINQLFDNLSLGQHGAINLFRNDGILLTRYPYDASQVNQDLGGSPHVMRLLGEKSGTFASVSPIDGVRRIISFERFERYPLVLTVALSVEEIFSAWQRKALVLSLATVVLCCAVVGLTILFQRELKRRTRAETKLRRIARTDDLTGLPNRRAFRETFEREWRHAVRSGSPLSLLYIDADYFKNFNDRYGHGQGDEALRAVAATLENNIRRPRDVAVRHGGEEFAIVLPETDLAGARLIAENIRQSIVTLGIAHEGSPYQVVTASIGIASVHPSRGSERATLLEAADRALYGAKAAGRNCVHHREAEADRQQNRRPHAAA
ncbi:sensor domain-containing diguanylate cyclase [Microvirga lotononidis]|uniref:sensor domain-containing diguanylate cyclase n=1 Tax=Microvirga lotononidis TaxID=864069 RepID=UPI0002F9D257|nr:sensor domain-containing diguanylate cyclase [Microvirga lotononidis]WQO28127.1 sensor domain-containing diguanylate cyclase [Microvirga lotononidis]